MNRIPCVSCVVLMALASFASADQSPVGWRTDGTGSYADATPPTEWGPDTNVVWKTEMPHWSNASPVIVGDRIFVAAEPDQLICVSKTDGKILWTAANPLKDAMSEADKAEAPALEKRAAEIRAKLKPLTTQQRDVYKDQRELEKKINDAKKAKQEPAAADVAKLEELKKQNNELRGQIDKLDGELAPCLKWDMPSTNGTNGHTSPTPVSDGKHVWVNYNYGVLACFDLEGNRQWITYVDRPQHGWGHCASPVLADGKVFVHMKFMKAFDAATGKLLWTANGTTWGWGTPYVTKVGGTNVLVTGKGDVIRVADGEVLAKGLANLTYDSPVIVGDTAYLIQSGGTATRLSMGDDGKLKAERLWTTKPRNDRYYGSPIVHDGLIYAITQRNIFSVIDASDGSVVNGGGEGVDLQELGKGTVYPSIAMAGGRLFVSTDSGITLVMEPGRSPRIVATNQVDTFRSCPVFEGGRMYLRTYKYLYCFGK